MCRVTSENSVEIVLIVVMLMTRCSATSVSLLLQIPVLLGVFLNSYYDVHFNILGAVYALVGVLTTSVYQIVSST